MTMQNAPSKISGPDDEAPVGIAPLAPDSLRGKVDRLLRSMKFQNFIMAVIIFNAITLGLETSQGIMAAGGGLVGTVLHILDKLALGIFVIEIALKLFAWRLGFFRQGWNIFDLLIVGISLIPASDSLSVLRGLRILRALRLFSMVPTLRRVVESFIKAIPGMSAVIAVLGLVYYICAVMATKLFGGTFPDWFGTLGESMYTLFQVMTLESWSMGIVRPVMVEYPWSWVFFLPFIMLTSFAILNLFIGIIVDSLQNLRVDEQHSEDTDAMREIAEAETSLILDEIRALRAEVGLLKDQLGKS